MVKLTLEIDDGDTINGLITTKLFEYIERRKKIATGIKCVTVEENIHLNFLGTRLLIYKKIFGYVISRFYFSMV